MDPGKLSAVTEWPTPTGVKAIQRFIGFPNYYHRFIKGFSKILAPITAMTCKGADSQHWSPGALQAFKDLKMAFSSAPILTYPDPTSTFHTGGGRHRDGCRCSIFPECSWI
ncbi:uncharacterized protein WCC33_006432 [Rhinophrynus dorsalis]